MWYGPHTKSDYYYYLSKLGVLFRTSSIVCVVCLFLSHHFQRSEESIYFPPAFSRKVTPKQTVPQQAI